MITVRKLMKALSFAATPMLVASMAYGQASTQATKVEQEPAPSQEKSQSRKTIRRIPSTQSRVTVVSGDSQTAPQVVTIVHRLSGLKMLRLLLRQTGEWGALSTVDPETINDDAHASIIAGWALDGGRTIAARLPQAAAEIEFTGNFPTNWPKDEVVRAQSDMSRAEALSRTYFPGLTEPDLTVVTRDGRKLRAHLVGLDGETGLSVLQVNGQITGQQNLVKAELKTGQDVQIYAPERTTPAGEAGAKAIYVKVGEIDATISDLIQAQSGGLERLRVRAAGLSPDVIGGVACDKSGGTLGIIDSLDGQDALVVPAETIRAATRRVLDRHASVPRPLLGVQGTPVEASARAALLSHGWHEDQLAGLLTRQAGILLLSVMPNTPAALAKLHAGDVILSVNEIDIKTAEEFSRLLNNAGSGERVQFTIQRPNTTGPLSIPVTLGGSFAPLTELHFDTPPSDAFPGFQLMGIETTFLTPRAAAQLGAQHGLLVLAVQAKSAAARTGMRAGDVIESIDGRMLLRGASTLLKIDRQKRHQLVIVRDRERKQVVVEPVE
jgi:serine protease Do